MDKVDFGKPNPKPVIYERPVPKPTPRRDPEPPKSNKKDVDLDELDKRIERRTKHPTTGERTKDLIFDLMDDVPVLKDAKHVFDKVAQAALEESAGSKLDYQTSQEAEETVKYASELAGERLGWSEEKTKYVEKMRTKAPTSFGQLENEKAKVLAEIEDKKDERAENEDS